VVVRSDILRSPSRETLLNYLPALSVDIVEQWISEKKIRLRISRHRRSKSGDYRCAQLNYGHRISINRDLNKYSFLITFIHEYAHLLVWERFRNKVKPHGKEWKTEYGKIVLLFLDNGIFPEKINELLKQTIIHTKAATSGYISLLRCLAEYDKPKDSVHIEALPVNATFCLPDGRIFRIEHKLRKRYKCFCYDNSRIYSFHPLAAVFPVN
jgi:SprT protein